ncbi:serine/threonine protein kinase [Colletotrichum tofieldiae]|nr:serine/threonine protein kinase [Colletotrichum tofieldiae]GKT74369.1 serine/threonine protein kinase [Colletotrichum tofieldiae]
MTKHEASNLRSSRDIRNEFLEYLGKPEIQRKTFDKKTFYDPQDIQRWMARTSFVGGPSNAVELLTAVNSDTTMHRKSTNFPHRMKAEEIGSHPILFAILVQMGCGHMIHIFVKQFRHEHFESADISQECNDIINNLETERLKVPKKYAKYDYRAVTDEFNRLRWAFEPGLHVLKIAQTHIRENHVLPFFYSKAINEKGGTANVHHVKVQADLVRDESLKTALEPSRKVDKDFGPYYEFAVKSYQKEWNEIYEIESEAFRGFNSAPNPETLGVVKYLGEYTRRFGEKPGEPDIETHHIMLEFGDRDLDEFLADKYPPILNGEIIAFWESVFVVAKSLQQIHQLEHAGVDGQVQKYSGWHGDIKPDNILRVRDEFKLADFGFTKFEKNEQGKPKSTVMLGGTLAYDTKSFDFHSTNAKHLRGS